jgi:hypothetical protein
MRPVGSVSAASAIRIGTARSSQSSLEPSPPSDTIDANRALIPLTGTAGTSAGLAPVPRPSAHFLAHLIATADQLPQTRERRRAEPQDAIAAYAATVAGGRLPGSQKFSRTS